jgi:hypothetical protein
MDETAANIIERETALADFDHARDDFVDAMEQVPDEAIDYKPEGEDYTLGYLVPHVAGSISMYSTVLDMMRDAQYEEVRLAAMPDEVAQIKHRYEARLAVPLRAEARLQDLEELEELHDRLASRLRDLAHQDYGRPSAVFYPGAGEAYPTRASDIIGWLTDHYREHAQQVVELLEAWKQTRTEC